MLTAGFGALLILIIVITLLGISRIYAINQRIEALVYEQTFKSELLTSILRITRERQQITLQLFVLKDDAGRETAYRQYQALIGQMFAAFDRLEEMKPAGVERVAITEAFNAATQSQEVRERVVALLMRGDLATASNLYLEQGLPTQGVFQESLNRLIDSNRAATLDAVSQSSLAMREALWMVAGVGVLLLMVGVGVAAAVSRQIVRSEDALHLEKELAEVTLHSIGDGVITVDAEGCIDYMNPVAEQYTGWNDTDAKGQTLDAVYRVVDAQTGKPIPHPGGSESGARGTSGITVTLLGRSGNACAIRDSFAPRHNSKGNLVGWVVVFHDVSQIQKMAEQLTWQASHDALTGLINRREFERRLAELIDSAHNDNKQHALMYMDLDNFKTVNDTCGHAAGDELLRQLTTVMLSKMRGSDTLARIGGDEFVALMPGSD